ncbi:sulfatase family protein [Marinoscillum furvescens]|uniref:Arylsulfatase A-like enzyme n=1 Tax=Marinoscillum furvescens DSM 4134 TaxID=1122208 RepID=A0A3D9L7C1_MARFU|nr:arylsulfatase [Marinoscillum furvescens]REE02215.1 arylsulfatase A-like enzyme [Marinoscillum furvescens DSM 4134]
MSSKRMILLMLLAPLVLLAYGQKPNIVLIYVDDLGYGDIGVNGAIGVKTPNVDALAARGINFTDAHCGASTCTPSRYTLLTGRYSFRRKAGILQGDAPLIIETDKGTLPKMLKEAGYTTGVVGKWHLGLGDGQVDWNGKVAPGPKEVGFDYSFLIPSTGDRVPCVYLENQQVVGLDPKDPITVSYRDVLDDFPVGREHPELLKQHTESYHLGTVINGYSRIGYQSGGRSALWVDEQFPFVLTGKSKAFITKNAKKPFFLYFSLHDIHQPRVPNIQFVESSSMGPRGDVIAQMDWCVGQIIQTLDSLKLTENTMVIFTSDNGPILDDGYLDYARELVGNHRPAGPFRGTKYSVYEGGTRVPTIVSWPGKVQPGVSSALLSQVDLYASIGKLVSGNVQDATDSQDNLSAWLGETERGREYLLEEAYTFGLRHGKWKYIQAKPSPVPGWISEKYVDPGFYPTAQLFDLDKDPYETNNLAEKYPEVTSRLSKKLNELLNTEQ